MRAGWYVGGYRHEREADQGSALREEMQMERYKNLGGDSNVVAYEVGPGSISVQFSDGSVYCYTDRSAGSENVSRMQSLARSGQGLNNFINTHVKYKYER